MKRRVAGVLLALSVCAAELAARQSAPILQELSIEESGVPSTPGS